MICSTRYRLKHNKTENQNYIGSFPFILNVLLWKRCFFENDLLLKGKKDFAESRRDESSVSKAEKEKGKIAMSRQFICSPLRTPSLRNIYGDGKRLRLRQIAGKGCVCQ